MTYSKPTDPEINSADLATLMGWAAAGPSWGELSFDQADGFAPAADVDLPGPDVNDERGYGFGV